MLGLTPSLDDAKSIPCDATNAQSILAPLPQSLLPNFIHPKHGLPQGYEEKTT